ncbi:MAG: 23S rRNA (adenine(2503)-C(2))-methyltransferase RlmN [Candidatus Omnitrophota bacterium]|nr:23S rRNA (adenine(2503)-C(2))-methyltransferase RlmN [Candidatus Omnitrophota bacterium]
MNDIKDLTPKELEQVLLSWKQESFHARQIFSWIYKKGVTDFDAMSDLPSDLRARLKEGFYILSLNLIKRIESHDGTEKSLFKLKDDNLIEAVIIPAEKRITGCISTQVGCKFACRFCASGKFGFKRNLTSSEMIEEVLYLKNNSQGRKLTHLVFMGIGEPLDNYDFVIKAIRIINSPHTFNIGARRITISTSGVIPAIKKLSGEGLQIELSVSLHAADDKTRSKLMPINKIYPVKDLIAACREYIRKTNRQITFEYVLIKDINSGLQDALKLSKILKVPNCKVNLIPCNAIKELKVQPPEDTEVSSFRDYLLKSDINVTLRRPRGQDIEAACGQLRLRYAKK